MSHLQTTTARIADQEAGAAESSMPSGPAAAPSQADPPFAAPPPYAGRVPALPELVRYHLREGEWRAGGNMFCAVVTKVHDVGTCADPLLDLVVIFDADDFMGLKNVGPRQGGVGVGWEIVPSQFELLQGDFDRFQSAMARAVLGENQLPEASLIDQLIVLRDEVETLKVCVATLQQSKASAKAAKGASIGKKAAKAAAKRK